MFAPGYIDDPTGVSNDPDKDNQVRIHQTVPMVTPRSPLPLSTGLRTDYNIHAHFA